MGFPEKRKDLRDPERKKVVTNVPVYGPRDSTAQQCCPIDSDSVVWLWRDELPPYLPPKPTRCPRSLPCLSGHSVGLQLLPNACKLAQDGRDFGARHDQQTCEEREGDAVQLRQVIHAAMLAR